ncbi:hypothetical protein [Aureispira anguillae]|uniref:Uncharacterized protein n=1 Tax=Aureispira anguillae TaxID=2864201 RepID=A0A915Y9W8_9BACT|nr:hypothetical protein [Aureispira anguillae]BDS09569.1 hypothetical protein AsAng_0002730 [Aureispira anguillae]
MAYKRVKGGEKNLKSGVRWTKDEIILVYKLYKELNGVGLHEHNPAIQKLASRLGRTVRSTEAQTLMFRNLERSGIYSHGNMNKLTKEVWNEFELKKTSKETEQEEPVFKYKDWNKSLVNHFFNEHLANQEIGCFPTSDELFQEISNFQYSVEDFINAISKEIGALNFFSKLEQLYNNSLPRKLGERVVRKPIPEYFGFIIFIIYALAEDESDNLTIANVYKRINHFGNSVLGDKWSKINSGISKSKLEPIWENLEEWSCQFKKGSLGYFIRHNPNNSNRKYVSRIERHSLFNSSQFSRIIDLLIDDGFIVGKVISKTEWCTFFGKHPNKLKKSQLILKYLTEEGPLQISIVKFLNSYCRQHYTAKTLSSEKAEFRTPPIPLRLCIDRLPSWPNDPISEFYFRALSENLEETILEYADFEYNISLDSTNTSNKLFLDVDLSEGLLIKSGTQRYMTNKNVYWLTKNHEFNEWREAEFPSNDTSFILIIDRDTLDNINISSTIKCNEHELLNTNHFALKFSGLEEAQFDEIYNIYNPYSKIEGKIDLISVFTGDRRKCIFKEFNPIFRYIGPNSSPQIIAINPKTKEKLCTLIHIENSDHLYRIPNTFEYEGQFQIKEEGGKIKSRYNLYFGNLSGEAKNISLPYLKDQEGKNCIELKRGDNDILDIPCDFYKKFDVSKFNQWHMNLFRLFNPKKKGNTLALLNASTWQLSQGDILLQFIAQNQSVSTYDFPKLLRELDSELSLRYSKRIMDHWRHLGYINFQDYGECIKVNPTAILFVRTTVGLRGYLCGHRTSSFINQLKQECEKISIQLIEEKHSNYKEDLYPTKFILQDNDGELSKFLSLKKTMQIDFVNDIEHPLNPTFAVYQLACLYTQRTVKEFLKDIHKNPKYSTDHHRKRVFDTNSLKWIDTTKEVETLPDLSVVRYEGFRDNSMTHIIKVNNQVRLLNELYLGIFSVLDLNKTILFKQKIEKNDEYDLLVPFFLGLPFWIERGLILINAEIPEMQKTQNTPFRVYRNIPLKIIKVIEEKLNQKILTL